MSHWPACYKLTIKCTMFNEISQRNWQEYLTSCQVVVLSAYLKRGVMVLILTTHSRFHDFSWIYSLRQHNTSSSIAVWPLGSIGLNIYFFFLLPSPSSHERAQELSRAAAHFSGLLLDVKLLVSIHESQVTSSESELFSISPLWGSAVQPVGDELKKCTVLGFQQRARTNCTDREITVIGRTTIHMLVIPHAFVSRMQMQFFPCFWRMLNSQWEANLYFNTSTLST